MLRRVDSTLRSVCLILGTWGTFEAPKTFATPSRLYKTIIKAVPTKTQTHTSPRCSSSTGMLLHLRHQLTILLTKKFWSLIKSAYLGVEGSEVGLRFEEQFCIPCRANGLPVGRLKLTHSKKWDGETRCIDVPCKKRWEFWWATGCFDENMTAKAL